MTRSYNPLLKLLIDKGLKRTQFGKMAGIHPYTIAAMGKNMPVSMETLERMCEYLDCELEDIVVYVPPKKEE